MKRIFILVLIAVLALGVVFGQDGRLNAVAPKDPRTMAMGGAFVAMSQGYQSFFGNPAGFAAKKAELTLATVNSWLYFLPTTENLDMMADVFTSGEDLVGSLGSLITDNGLGGGSSFGIGLAGGRLGLGLVGSFDAYVRGRTLTGAVGTIDGQIAAIAGIGIPFRFLGIDVSLGGNIRPYIRLTGDGPVAATDILGYIDGGDPMVMPVLVGYGLAVDLGARLDFGRFLSVGLAARDISTSQTLARTTLGAVLESGGLDDLGGDSVAFEMLPNLTFGVSLRPLPVGMAKLLDLLLVVELQNPLLVLDALKNDEFAPDELLPRLLHAGAELNVLGGFLTARAGINKGYLSLGGGIDLAIIEFNMAVFTEELGFRLGDRPRTGISAELAIRF